MEIRVFQIRVTTMTLALAPRRRRVTESVRLAKAGSCAIRLRHAAASAWAASIEEGCGK